MILLALVDRPLSLLARSNHSLPCPRRRRLARWHAPPTPRGGHGAAPAASHTVLGGAGCGRRYQTDPSEHQLR